MKLHRDGALPRVSMARMAGLAILAMVGAGPGCSSTPGSPTPLPPSATSQCLSRASFGDPAESPYVLPFAVGESHDVFQTYCGAANHGQDNQLAYDIEMPLDSPVLAARAGVVIEVFDTHLDSNEYDRVANDIRILHDDGTVAFYAHLRQHSARVREGDHVEVGQHIADVGYLGNPVAVLLHFGVYRTWPTPEGNDLAVNFRNAEGPLDERGGLQEGTSYRALPY